MQKLDICFNELKSQINRQNKLYFSEFEIRTRGKRGMTKIVKAPDFVMRYKKLLSGLSRKDKETLYNVVLRLNMLEDLKGPIDIFTDDEKARMVDFEQFQQQILKIDENLYCYHDYFLPINYFEPGVFLFRHGIDELRHPERIRGKCILDIGAFIGDSALVLNELTDGKIYCFEPVTDNYNLMFKTLELNNLKNVVPINGGAGAENAVIPIYLQSNGSTALPLLSRTKNVEKCRIYKIDDFVDEHNLSVGLIKVDIEGYEQEFIKGAVKTIKTQRPTLLLSIYHTVDDFLDIKPIIEDMDAGYKFKIFKPADGLVSTELLLICEQ